MERLGKAGRKDARLKQSKKDTSGFSFSPDVMSLNDSGQDVISKRNWYIMLGSETQGTIFYSPLANQYFIAEGVEVEPEMFNSRFLPYLRWDFDKIEKVEIEIDLDVNGKKVKKGTGNFIEKNNFPPTPENIEKMRLVVMQDALKQGETLSADEVLNLTLPRLLLNEGFTTNGPQARRARRY